MYNCTFICFVFIADLVKMDPTIIPLIIPFKLFPLFSLRDFDGDVYLIKITTWQWVIKSISILIRTSQNGISTK
jgi:hypothetical protein